MECAVRVAVVFKDRCQPKRCHLECIAFCPPQRTGTEVIWIDPETTKAAISEETCISCGICVRKCPFDAIRIIGLPEALKEDLVHQYGKNAFRLFRLPVPKKGEVTGLLGPNGIGKTTCVGLLSGEVAPNLGHYRRKKAYWEEVLDYFAGTELHDYLARIANKKLTTAIKPQYVDKLSKIYTGRVRDLLTKIDKRGRLAELTVSLDLGSFLDRDIAQLSGGELQRLAIAATMLKDADVYFFDEPSSYLDIYQRLQVAKVIQSLSKEKYVVVVEHDLAVLDFLAETVFLMYGEEGAYGIIAQPRAVRTAINVYLGGYLKEENIRFRDREIRFDVRPPRGAWKAETLVTFDDLTKRFDDFELTVHSGRLRKGEVVGVVGPNATGKTTFVKMLAGEEKPTSGAVQGKWQVSYKPQYLDPLRWGAPACRDRVVPRPRRRHLLDRRAIGIPRFEPEDGGSPDDSTRHGEGSTHGSHRRPRRLFHRHGLRQHHGVLGRPRPPRNRRGPVPDAGGNEPVPEASRHHFPARRGHEPAADQQTRFAVGPRAEGLGRILLRD